MKRRIAITGLGLLTPIGSGHKIFLENLKNCIVGTSDIQSFDTSRYTTHKGGEVQDTDPRKYLQNLDPEETDRTTQLAVAAAHMAIKDARLGEEYDPERVGVCMGTTLGNHLVIEHDHNLKQQFAKEAPSPLIAHHPQGYISAAIAEEFGFEGPCLVVPTACAAGNYAISWGSDLIRNEQADMVIVGGSDGMSRLTYTIFNRLGAIAPEKCQPFDKNRKGMMVSEGAAALILEDWERAKQRGATIYAEFLGYGLSCDAHHPTAPHPEGLGAVEATRKALKDAGIKADDVSYISAHGTGTRANDTIESRAIREVFGERADRIAVSSIKSMLGHTMGAASAIEAVTCALALHHSIVPPTVNYEQPDPECITNVVPNRAITKPIDVAISNSFAFGGNISIIVMRRAG